MTRSPHAPAPNDATQDLGEIAKFDAMAARFWDPLGPFRPLHELNPLRLEFVRRFSPLSARRVLDVGCGGGLMAEAMTRSGAVVTGIDLSSALIETAQLHALSSGLAIDYRRQSVESIARSGACFDELLCLEMLEHVPDPFALLKPFNALLPIGGGLTLSTLNRTPMAYLVAVLGAEYVLKRLPIGTHDYHRFIKPSELGRALEAAGFEVVAIQGLAPKPFQTRMGFSPSVAINYLLRARKITSL